MNFFHKLFSNSKTETHPNAHHSEPYTVYAPFSGMVIPIEEIGDGVFSEKILGPGCGIEPEDECVYAPFDGTVSQLTDTKHAIGITNEDGIELLIHIGMDTVYMKGKGFSVKVKEGQKISLGDELITFNASAIKAEGHKTTCAVIVTNPDEFACVKVIDYGNVKQGTPIIKVQKKV